jgi:hypothetical protein
MADISSYIEYFRRLAAEHKDINGFYMMDINEPLDALRSTIKYPALILTSLSGSFEASNLDNILDSFNGGFMILGHLSQVNDFSAEMQLVSKMKQIGNDVIARMLNDHLKCELLALKAIPGFNINSVNYEMLGPVFDNDFGLMYTCKFQDCHSIQYDPIKWSG